MNNRKIRHRKRLYFATLGLEQLEERRLLALTATDVQNGISSAIGVALVGTVNAGVNTVTNELPSLQDSASVSDFAVRSVLNPLTALAANPALQVTEAETPTQDRVVLDVSFATPSGTTSSFTLPSTIQIFGIVLSVPNPPSANIDTSLTFNTRIQIEDTNGSDPGGVVVSLVPVGGALAKLVFTSNVDLGSPGASLGSNGSNPTGLVSLGSGKVAGILDYKGSIDVLFKPTLTVQYAAANGNPVALANLPAPTGDVTYMTPGGQSTTNFTMSVPLVVQLTIDSLPGFEYRTNLLVGTNAISESSRQVFLHTGPSTSILVADESGFRDRGVLINELLTEEGFPLLGQIAGYINPELANALLGDAELFDGITIDTVLGDEFFPDKGFIENADGSPLNYLQIFPFVTPEVVDILEIVLQLAQDRGQFETAITNDTLGLGGSLDSRASRFGFEFPIAQSSSTALQGVRNILRGQDVDLVTYEYDIVDQLLRNATPAERQLLEQEGILVGNRLVVDLNTGQLLSAIDNTIEEMLEKLAGTDGKVNQAFDLVKQPLLDAVQGLINVDFQMQLEGVLKGGVDTAYAGDPSNILNLFYLDRSRPIIDFDLNGSISVGGFIDFGDLGQLLENTPIGDLIEASDPAIGPILEGISDPGGVFSLTGNPVISPTGNTGLLAEISLHGGVKVDWLNPGQPPTELRGAAVFQLSPLQLLCVHADLTGGAKAEAKLLGAAARTPKSLENISLVSFGQTCDGSANSQTPVIFAIPAGSTLIVLGSAEDDHFEIDFDAARNVVIARWNGAVNEFDLSVFDNSRLDQVLVDLRGQLPEIVPGRPADGGNDQVQLTVDLNDLQAAQGSLPVVAVLGGSGDDVITAHEVGKGFYNGVVQFSGGGGEDELVGGGGESQLLGEDDADVLRAGPGPVTMLGGGGDDLLEGLSSAVGITPSNQGGTMVGGEGRDVLSVGRMSRGSFILIGGNQGPGATEGSIILGGFGNDVLVAGNLDGAPDLNSGAASLLSGGPGDDSLFGTPGADALFGGWLEAAETSGIDQLLAGAGNDLLLPSNPSFTDDFTDFHPTETDPQLQTGNEFLDGADGDDRFLIGAGGAAVVANGQAGEDLFVIASDHGSSQSTVDEVFGDVIVNGGADRNQLVVDDFGGGGNTDVRITVTEIRGMSPGLITYFATDDGFFDFPIPGHPGGAGVHLIGSDTTPDTFTIESFLQPNTLLLEGNGGNDLFNIGIGDLNPITGVVTLNAGAGAEDSAVADDSAHNLLYDYRLTPTQFESTDSEQSPFGQLPRTFGGVHYDGSMEAFTIDGSAGSNVFRIFPSSNTEYFLHGDPPEIPTAAGASGRFDIVRNGIVDVQDLTVLVQALQAGLDGQPASVAPQLDLNGDGTLNIVDALELLTFLRNHYERAPLPQGDISQDPGERDFLRLELGDIGEGVVGGQQITFTNIVDGRQREGFWQFTSNHQQVNFSNMERFNHIDKLIIGSDAGQTADSLIEVKDAATGNVITQLITNFQNDRFNALEPSFNGGVRVVDADLNGDGVSDIIVGSGANHTPEVRVFNGIDGSPLGAPLLLPESGNLFGVNVAAADVDGDGRVEVITSQSRFSNTIYVWKFDGAGFTASNQFNSGFDANSIGGVTVAAGDINGDDIGEIIAGSGPGQVAQIKIFNFFGQQLNSIVPFGQSARGGVNVAVGDINGDGFGDIVAGAGRNENSQVALFAGSPDLTAPLVQLGSVIQAYNDQGNFADVNVAVKDVDGDLEYELYTAQGTDGQTRAIRRWEWTAGVDALFQQFEQQELDPRWDGFFVG